MKALTEINLRSEKKDERNEAEQIKKKLQRFDFIFCLVLLVEVLGALNLASKILQNPNADLMSALDKLLVTKDRLIGLRQRFNEKKEEAAILAVKWKITPQFKSRRPHKTKKHFDELVEDHRFCDGEDRFRVTVFNATLDIVISQISNRFEGTISIAKMFAVFHPQKFLDATEEDLVKAAEDLLHNYPKDFSKALPVQLVSMRSVLQEEIKKASCISVKDLARLVLVEYSCIASNYPEVCSALMLFLTIPVTTATAERSFSKLKIIKNYLRNTMTEDRLHGLSLLSIEARRAKTIEIDSIINAFANAKARKKFI